MYQSIRNISQVQVKIIKGRRRWHHSSSKNRICPISIIIRISVFAFIVVKNPLNFSPSSPSHTSLSYTCTHIVLLIIVRVSSINMLLMRKVDKLRGFHISRTKKVKSRLEWRVNEQEFLSSLHLIDEWMFLRYFEYRHSNESI